jgi:protein O-GlcNAc transferase
VDVTLNYEGREVRFYDVTSNDGVGMALLAGNWYELSNLQFIQSLHVEGNYVDAGAYIGTHSLFFSLFCPSSTVYSFEPQPTIYPMLVHNLEANGATNCKPFKLALSDTPGFGIVPGEYGGARLIRNNDPNAVRVATLDSLGLENIRLMKVDVEHSELKMLMGAMETLKSVEHLFVEMWTKPTCIQYNIEYTAPQIARFLEPLGLRAQKELGVDLYYFNRSEATQIEF